MASWYTYNVLSGYRSQLSNGGGDVTSFNSQLDQMDDLRRAAVKGDYYGASGGDFSSLREKAPDSDGKISSAKSYVYQEMEAIRREIEEEERRRREEAERRRQEAAARLRSGF